MNFSRPDDQISFQGLRPDSVTIMNAELLPALVPQEVATVEARGEVTVRLPPAELELVVRAVATRRSEFVTTRACAHRALSMLGVPDGPIMRGEWGEPLWPDGVVGSMTHCRGYRAAAVARYHEIRSIGIDAEPAELLPIHLVEVVASKRESGQLTHLASRYPDVPWCRLLFSAKEAVYKTWYPLTGQWMDFEDICVIFDDSGEFSWTLWEGTNLPTGFRGCGAPSSGTGRWVSGQGVVATAVVIAHNGATSHPPDVSSQNHC